MCWGWSWLPIHVTGLLLCRARSGWAVRFVGAEDAPSCPRGGGFATYVADVSAVIDRCNCGESSSVIVFAHARSEDELCGRTARCVGCFGFRGAGKGAALGV